MEMSKQTKKRKYKKSDAWYAAKGKKKPGRKTRQETLGVDSPFMGFLKAEAIDCVQTQEIEELRKQNTKLKILLAETFLKSAVTL